MKTQPCHPPVCKNCRFFQPEGRYQGSCHRLQAIVRGEWLACNLSLSAFCLRAESGETI